MSVNKQHLIIRSLTSNRAYRAFRRHNVQKIQTSPSVICMLVEFIHLYCGKLSVIPKKFISNSSQRKALDLQNLWTFIVNYKI